MMADDCMFREIIDCSHGCETVEVVTTKLSPEDADRTPNVLIRDRRSFSETIVPLEYLDLIDDLASELDTLKLGLAKNESQAFEAIELQENFVNNLKQLAKHNEELEKALEKTNEEKEILSLDLQNKNKTLIESIRKIQELLTEHHDKSSESHRILQEMLDTQTACVQNIAGDQKKSNQLEEELKAALATIEELKKQSPKELSPRNSQSDTEVHAFGDQNLKTVSKRECDRSQCRKTIADLEVREQALKNELTKFKDHHQAALNDLKQEYELILEKDKKRFDGLSKEFDVLCRQFNMQQQVNRDLNKKLVQSNHKYSGAQKQYQNLSKTYENLRQTHEEVFGRHETLSRTFEDQTRKLAKCLQEVQKIESKYNEMEKNLAQKTYEKKQADSELFFYKAETESLKAKLNNAEEREAVLLNKIDVLYQQTYEQQDNLKKSEEKFKGILDGLQKENDEKASQIKDLTGKNNVLSEENSLLKMRTQTDYVKEVNKILENYRNWKVAQLVADRKNLEKIKKYQETIRLLLLDRQNFIEIFYDLHRDFEIIQAELRRVRKDPEANQNISSSLSETSFQDRLQMIHKTLYRIADSKESFSSTGDLSSNPVTIQEEQSISQTQTNSSLHDRPEADVRKNGNS